MISFVIAETFAYLLMLWWLSIFERLYKEKN